MIICCNIPVRHYRLPPPLIVRTNHPWEIHTSSHPLSPAENATSRGIMDNSWLNRGGDRQCSYVYHLNRSRIGCHRNLTSIWWSLSSLWCSSPLQSTNQEASQWINQSTNAIQFNKLLFYNGRVWEKQVLKNTDSPSNQLTNQPTKHSLNQPTNQPTIQSINQSIN